MKNLVLPAILSSALLSASGCTASSPEVANNLSTALDVASTLEGAYAARPGADPKVVAEMTRLLAAGRAALTSWQTTGSPSDQAVASAAIAALVAYEAAAQPPSKS